MILNEPFNTTFKKPEEVLRPIKTINETNFKGNKHLADIDPEKPKSNDYFFVRNAGRYERIDVNNILFIKACGSYSQIITKSSTFTLAINMKSILAQILSDKIVKCHRSFAVNIDRIRAFDDISIYIAYNEKVYELPLSITYRKSLHVLLPRLKS